MIDTGFAKIVPAHEVKVGDSLPNVGTVTYVLWNANETRTFLTDGLKIEGIDRDADVMVTITPEEAFDLI